MLLQWNSSSGTTQYRIEAGSQPGASTVQFNTGSAQTSFFVPNVPNGTYYVRVRAIGSGGVSGPSNEVPVTVGSVACTGPPAAPTGLAATTLGRSVSLTWSTSGVLTSVVIEAGSAPGASNVGVFTLAPGSVSASATAAPGTYHVRVRAVNSCGSTLAANELVITVM